MQVGGAGVPVHASFKSLIRKLHEILVVFSLVFIHLLLLEHFICDRVSQYVHTEANSDLFTL